MAKHGLILEYGAVLLNNASGHRQAEAGLGFNVKDVQVLARTWLRAEQVSR